MLRLFAWRHGRASAGAMHGATQSVDYTLDLPNARTACTFVRNNQGAGMKTRVGLLLGALLASGCSSLNEGAVDVRRHHVNTANGAGNWVVRSQAEGIITRAETVAIDLDVVSIGHLINEGRDLDRIFNTGDVRARRGEIAVLARVVPVDDKNQVGRNWTSFDGHRLIFYSGDALQQRLNMRNLPIFGPAVLPSGRVEIDIAIIELDRSTAQMESLLSTLTELGTQALTPANAALAPLLELGSALLAGDHDDVEFRYRAVFDIDHAGKASLPLVAGRYVLMRSELRNDDQDPWAGVCLAVDTGVLHEGSSADDEDECAAGPEVRDRTYLTLRVTPGLPDTANSTGMTFADLGAELDALENVTVGALQDGAAALLLSRKQSANADSLEGATAGLIRMAGSYTDAICTKPATSDDQEARAALMSAAFDYYGRLVPMAQYLKTGAPQNNADGSPGRDGREVRSALQAADYERQAHALAIFIWGGDAAVAKLAAVRDPKNFGVASGEFLASATALADALAKRSNELDDVSCPVAAVAS